MGTKLTYDPLPSGGYTWNLLNKINMKIGKRPGTSTNSRHTYIYFIEDLTAQEIADVDAIIGDGSTAKDSVEFATVNNRYIIKDIWEWRNEIEAELGFNIAITYRSSGTHGDRIDEIVFQPTDPTYQAEKLLDNTDKRNIVSALEGLIRLE